MSKLVRKQLYIEPRQDSKLKRLAAVRHATQAELVREAIDNLPEEEDELTAFLRASGLLAPKPPLPPDMQGVDLEELDAQLEAELGDLDGVTLSDAVLQEREESRY